MVPLQADATIAAQHVAIPTEKTAVLMSLRALPAGAGGASLHSFVDKQRQCARIAYVIFAAEMTSRTGAPIGRASSAPSASDLTTATTG